MNILVKMVSENDEEVTNLRTMFQAMDKDGSGMILASELADILQKKEIDQD